MNTAAADAFMGIFGFTRTTEKEMEADNPEPTVRPSYQTWVFEEKDVLDIKIEALGAFLDLSSVGLDPKEERRMRAQHSAMKLYSWILMERIEAFK